MSYNGYNISVVIPAAGMGKRMKRKINKQYIKLNNKSILAHTVEKFERCEMIDEIVIVVRNDEIEYCKENVVKKYKFEKVSKIICGGEERQDSVYNGIKAINEACDIILIHDGARPLIDNKTIIRSIKETLVYDACVVGVPVKNTIKIVNSEGYISDTPDRNKLWAVQTPQIFKYDILNKAHKIAKQNSQKATDDSMLVEGIGYEVKMIMGSYDNIKITTPEDLSIAKAILNQKEGELLRTGIGYDVHKLVKGRRLILGGVQIDHSTGLLGHSDADVLIHAIMDSILGALGIGDIGKFFPDTDSTYKDISSLKLLNEVYKKVTNLNYEVNNIDCIIIAQKPKLSPYISDMEDNISNILNIEKKDINIKATTTEKLGFEGREEGISAQAVCVLKSIT